MGSVQSKLRPRSLPPGWYPAGGTETRRRLERFLSALPPGDAAGAWAGVAPHAGWEFSGRLACRVVRALAGAQTIVVVGGHLASGDGVLAAGEEGYETPLGTLPADLELLAGLRDRLPVAQDRWADNTVEIQLPILRHLAPGARALGLRAAPSRDALVLGEALAAAADRLGRSVAVLGSTDLTHYGPNYGFTPRGTGSQALQWVREENDRHLVDALVNLELERVLELARRDHSACSAGGAVAAARYAAVRGAAAGRLLEYATSHEVMPGSSFVGYAAIIYPDSG